MGRRGLAAELGWADRDTKELADAARVDAAASAVQAISNAALKPAEDKFDCATVCGPLIVVYDLDQPRQSVAAQRMPSKLAANLRAENVRTVLHKQCVVLSRVAPSGCCSVLRPARTRRRQGSLGIGSLSCLKISSVKSAI